MYRYGSSGEYRGGRRRRSHRLRNSLIVLLALLLSGAALASTEPGSRVLDPVLKTVGLRDDKPGPLANATPAPSATAAASAQNSPTSAPTKGQPTEANTAIAPTQANTQGPDATNTTSPPGVATNPPKGTKTPNPPVAPTGISNVPPRPTLPVNPTGQPPTVAPTAPAPTALAGPNPLETANAYLGNWQALRYADMYTLLSKDSRAKYPRDKFVERYGAVAERATLVSVAPKLSPEAQEAAKGQELLLNLPITVKMQTAQVGEIVENNVLPLVKEDDVWRVQWSPSLIFKDLKDDTYLRRLDYPGTRGSIFDRNGKPLAIDGGIAQLQVIPGKIENEQELLNEISQSMGIPKAEIKAKYKDAQPDWVVPIRDVSQQRAQDLQWLTNIAGVQFGTRPGRVYTEGTALAQILGLVAPVSAEELKKPEYASYSPTDFVGRSGLEYWGEQYLRGQTGGKLYIVNGAEVEVANIKEREPQRGSDIYLNIDVDLQRSAEAEFAKKGLWGSVVALDPNNGEILAAVSQPSYDPNAFIIGISQSELDRLNNPDSGNPFLNRATESAYPMASTFKPITMAAGLEFPLPDLKTRVWYDEGTWNKDGTLRGDWKEGGHGQINLLGGLIQSCDIVFYDLGYELYLKDQDYLTDFAKKWGLGSAMGVDGAFENPGLVPGPGSPAPGWNPGDNVNLAIGQGALQASPLQAANVYATISNGGTIYQPHLINRIVATEGKKVLKAYPPKVLGKAPVKPETIEFIQRGLKGVTQSDVGTARLAFQDAPISVAGKTGTGEQDQQEPFAWFAGYAPADKPQVVVLSLAENAGEGSQISAPIVRVVMESYLKPPVARP